MKSKFLRALKMSQPNKVLEFPKNSVNCKVSDGHIEHFVTYITFKAF